MKPQTFLPRSRWSPVARKRHHGLSVHPGDKRGQVALAVCRYATGVSRRETTSRTSPGCSCALAYVCCMPGSGLSPSCLACSRRNDVCRSPTRSTPYAEGQTRKLRINSPEFACRGIEVWNRWKEDIHQVLPQDDFPILDAGVRGIDLYGANLNGINLGNVDLTAANIDGAHQRGANLAETELAGATGIDARLKEANLSDANLCAADLPRADLSRANLSGACLSQACLQGANLYGADLRGAPVSPRPI